ncbi:PREDICTED: ras-like GTP-binding protein RhoL [Nicrophorus vespilloides]|uniref:Ras-like GTP-binding protein RhoL n=1 Tax=Nicrophorus vespilloides TaxID=110193 RepID=A0ABM1M9L6_NICVS|nr:PREDICTED: ras-like GTP-binding protein RhoL [Nicrophorus vespilloides]
MERSITIVAVGDADSRKTELLIKYTYNKHIYEFSMPSRFENNVREIIVDYNRYNVHFIDAECDDDYEILRWEDYEKADCVVLCYSIGNRRSFERTLRKWCVEVRRTNPDVPVILVATDTELRGTGRRGCVKTEEGEDLKCALNACALVECSVEKLVGIDDVFIEAVRSTYCFKVHNRFYHSL